MNRTFTRLLIGLVALPMTMLAQVGSFLTHPGETADFSVEPSQPLLANNTAISGPSETPEIFSNAFMDFTVTASSAAVTAGEEICIQFTVANFIDIVGMEFVVTYDSNFLEFVSVGNFNLSGLNQSSFGLPGQGVNQPGRVKVSWFDNNVAGVNLADGTSLFELCLRAKANSPTTQVGIGFVSPEIIDVNSNIVPFVGMAGTVSISGGGGNNPGPDLSAAIGSSSAQPGQQVCVPVSVQDFTDLTAASFTINYDPNVLTFNMVQNLNLSGLTTNSFQLPGQGANPTGAITMNWAAPSNAGVSVTNGTTIFDLCFTPTTPSTSTNLSFAGGATVTDNTQQSRGFNGTGGAINIGAGSNNQGSDGPFTIDISDAAVGVGGEVCVDVAVSGFQDIVGMEFVVTYDPTALEFTEVRNLNLSDLNQASFGLPGSGNNLPGSIKLSWFDQAVAGVTVNNGTVIFQLCFRGLRNSSPVLNFAANPEIIDQNNNLVPFNGNPGTITVGAGGSAFERFTLMAGNATVQAGDTVCIPVSVGLFEDLGGMEFTIGYDVNALEFVEVKDFNLVDLNENSFGLPGGGGNLPGNIKVSWFDQGAQGVSVPDNQQIFMVCFRAIGSGMTTVAFDEQSSIEIIDINDQQIPYDLVDGTITIEGELPTTDFVLRFSNETVSPGGTACVDVSVDNFTNILGMEFTMEYDPAILDFVEVKDFNLAQLNESSFGLPGVGVNQPGFIKVSWFDQTVQGVSIPIGTRIFSACFAPRINSGTTPIQTVSQQGSIEIIDINDDQVPFQERTGSITISAFPPLVVNTPVLITDVSCFNGNNGSIDIEVQGGAGNYTYQWSHQGATSQDLDNLSSGPYTVTISDQTSGQQLIQTYVVGQPVAPVAISMATPTDVLCAGDSTGAISLTIGGGTAPYTFNWTGGLPAVEDQTGLSAGTYAVTVTDANGCRLESQNITINEPATAIEITSEVTDATCNGQADGAISLTVSGGAGAYSYDWSGTLTDELDTQSSLAAGSYSVTVADANGCQADAAFMVTESAAIVVQAIEPQYIGAGIDGAVSLIIGGGSGGFTFSWTGPNAFSAATEDLTGLTEPGEYCVAITDDSGCSTTACIMVLEQLRFTDVNMTPSCFNSANGSVSVNVLGGLAPYQYNWNTGDTTNELTGLAQGSYVLTVTDAQGSSFTGTFEIQELSEIAVTETIIAAVGPEGASNGRINLNVVGGAPGYTFNWDNGATTVNLTNIQEGEYCVTITDQAGCTYTDCYQVDRRSQPLAFTSRAISARCNGEASGSVIVDITGGLPPYIISFSDEVMISSMDGDIMRDDVRGGRIDFIITDAAGTVINGFENVPQPDPISIEVVSLRHDTEDAGCVGQIEIAVSGGQPGYGVNWNSPNTGTRIISLCEGSFVPTVQDANGCTQTFPGIEVNAFAVSGTVTNTDCEDISNGLIDLNVDGGAGNYTFEWTDEEGNVVSTDEDLSGAAMGSYSVKVTEASGNILVRQFTVRTRSRLAVSLDVLSNYRGFAVSCPNGSDGRIAANAANGTSGNFVYQWTYNDQVVGGDSVLNNAAPGVYELTVMDEFGCAVSETVKLDAPPAMEIQGFVTDVACPGDRNGEIFTAVSGGAGGYTYSWSNDATGPRVGFLPTGTYTVTVTDANNCAQESSFTVEEPLPITVTLQTEPATDGCNGAAQAVVTGGRPPFLFRWSVDAPNTSSTITGLCPGEYGVRVTDARGCSAEPQMIVASVLDRRFPCMDIRPVITPDGDGLNEEFVINCIEELNQNYLWIYNRWGQLVFERANYDNTWAGRTADGEQLPDGAYYFVLEYRDIDNVVQQVKGSITLLRE